MCYTSTPIHSCTHFGPVTVTSACVCGSATRACRNSVGTGCRNVDSLCPTCAKVGLGMRGVDGLGLMGMLNAIDVAVGRATRRSSGGSRGSSSVGIGSTPPSSGAVTPALTDDSSVEPSASVSGISTPLEDVPVLGHALATLVLPTAGGRVQDVASCALAGVPDLGFLGDLGAPECTHGRQTVHTFNLHWRAFAQKNVY